MASIVYKVNKGINQSIEFKGLKAQYIWYLGGGVILLMALFAVLYIAGLPTLFCLALIAMAGTLLVINIYKMSRKYGEHGMMKAFARWRLPSAVRFHSRSIYFNCKKGRDDGKAYRGHFPHT